MNGASSGGHGRESQTGQTHSRNSGGSFSPNELEGSSDTGKNAGGTLQNTDRNLESVARTSLLRIMRLPWGHRGLGDRRRRRAKSAGMPIARVPGVGTIVNDQPVETPLRVPAPTIVRPSALTPYAR